MEGEFCEPDRQRIDTWEEGWCPVWNSCNVHPNSRDWNFCKEAVFRAVEMGRC